MSRLWSGERPPEKPAKPARRHARLYEAEYAKQQRRIERIRNTIVGGKPSAPAERAGRSWDEPPASAPRRAGTPAAPAPDVPPAPAPPAPTPPPPPAPAPPRAIGARPRSAGGWQPPRPGDTIAPPAAAPYPRPAAPGDEATAGTAAPAGDDATAGTAVPAGDIAARRSRRPRFAGAAILDGSLASRRVRLTVLAGAVAVAVAVLLVARLDRVARPELMALPAPATDLVSGGGRLWVASPQTGAVWILSDESGDPVEPAIRTAGTPARLGVRNGVAWAADTENSALVRLDARRAPVRVGPDVAGVALAGGAVWTASAADGGIRVLDRRVRTVAVVAHPVALASDGRNVVVAGAGGAVVWLDGRTRAPVATVRTGGMPVAAAISEGAAWIADASGRAARRVGPRTAAGDPAAGVVAGPPIALGARPVAIAARGSDVYVACRGRLVRIDARRGVVAARAPLGVEPAAIAVDDEYVWIAAAGRNVVARFDRRRLS